MCKQLVNTEKLGVLVQKYLCDGSPVRGNMQIAVIGFLMTDIKFFWQSSKNSQHFVALV